MRFDTGCTRTRPTSRPNRLLAIVVAAAASTPSARGQELLWQFDGQVQQALADPLAALTDIDGDGIPEVLASRWGGGAVLVLSGATGAKLWEWDGTGLVMGFGDGIADAGDVNGDGVADVIVGVTDNVAHTGEAYVYSGADGSTLYTLLGTNVGDRFGAAVLGLGDVDGDGLGDFAIGAPTGHVSSTGFDRVEVRSGSTGLTLYTVYPTAPGDNLGESLALLDDFDGDGLRDFAAGAPAGNYVDIVSSKSGAILLTIPGTAPYDDYFGQSLAAFGDLDGDGFGDLLVGSPRRHAGQNLYAGAAEVFSTGTGALLLRRRGTTFTQSLGITVASAGDSNGDGSPDLLIGSWSNYAELVSGASGRLLYRFKGHSDSYEGAGVSGGVDFDGDGLADVVIGVPLNDWQHGGRVEMRRGNDLYLDSEPYGPTEGATMTLTLGEGVPGNLALMAVVGVNGTPMFLSLALAQLDVNGELALAEIVPAGLSGTSADLVGLAISASGRLAKSAVETVAFQ